MTAHRPLRIALAVLGCVVPLLAEGIPDVWEMLADSAVHTLFRSMALPDAANDVYDLLALLG